MFAALQRWVVFPRHLVAPLPGAGEGVEGLERLWLSTPQGRVEAWFLPGLGQTGPGPAVVFAHGNAELIDFLPAEVETYRRWGVSVLLPEFRGYGRSAGSPSQAAITDDFTAFYDRLVARPDVDPQRVFFHGRSLGGGAVCALARRRAPAALILASTFTSVRELARSFLVPGFLVHDPFDNVGLLASFAGPVLLFHGRADRVVPFRHGERLHQASANSHLVAFDCGHSDCPPDPRPYWQAIGAFLTEHRLLELPSGAP